MNILIVIGAGASFDCWPEHVPRPTDYKNYRLPLAKELFSPYHHQGDLLKEYNLLNIASILRSKASELGDDFDIETELLNISERANRIKDLNTLQSLFKTRFYLQRLITLLTQNTVDRTVGHTAYIDLIRKLKHWTEDDPENRVIDIVTFNYDTLLEKAMETHYSVDWKSKNIDDRMSAYYRGNNVRIYKPHGSIDWGREVNKGYADNYSYYEPQTAFNDFHHLTIQTSIHYVEPNNFSKTSISKRVIPAIAIPFKEKSNFDECPGLMLQAMTTAINNADYILTLGWRGSEKHFTSIIESNNHKIKKVHVVSPNGTTQLSNIFPAEIIKPIKLSFGDFVSRRGAIESLLESFN